MNLGFSNWIAIKPSTAIETKVRVVRYGTPFSSIFPINIKRLSVYDVKVGFYSIQYRFDCHAVECAPNLTQFSHPG